MTDAERFTRMYDAHHRRVYAYAVTRAGREHADDVVGDTFLVAWRRVREIPATPLPWLLGVARNVARERYRDEARQAAIAAELRAWVREAEDDVAEPPNSSPTRWSTPTGRRSSSPSARSARTTGRC